MTHDPLVSIKRLEDTFGNLQTLFAQYRKQALKVHGEQEFALSARNEQIKALNEQLARAQTTPVPATGTEPDTASLGKALAEEKSRTRELGERNRLLESKINVLQEQILADRADVKAILSQLDEVFAELDHA